MTFEAQEKGSDILFYPKELGITKAQVLRERNKLYNPDIWELKETREHYILKMNKNKARKKLREGTFKSSRNTNHHNMEHGFHLDLGEPKGFYYGTKEKKRTGFGEIDFDFGLKL